MKTLKCYSFHSVKGGVGKSTLSTVCASAIAANDSNSQVFLVDVDLTGTSLSDVLPIEAPEVDVEPGGAACLAKGPNTYLTRGESKKRVEVRSREENKPTATMVPFLNDYLLYKPEKWKEEEPIDIKSLCWRMEEGPENLSVIPASALPADLERILPVIFDEEHSAFLEARLEYLLAVICQNNDQDEACVVFDTPPSIPGLSRAILSMAIRLSGDKKEELSEDGGMPPALANTRVEWKAFIVVSPDVQDICAAARWASLVRPREEEVVRIVINRAESGAEEQVNYRLNQITSEAGIYSSLFRDPVFIQHDDDLRLFGDTADYQHVAFKKVFNKLTRKRT